MFSLIKNSMAEEKEVKFTGYRFDSEDDFYDFLDQGPDEGWIQIRYLDTQNTKKHEYIPIAITEANADLIFNGWWVVSEDYVGIENGILCTVKIHAYPSYAGSDLIVFTGSAAVYFKSPKNSIEFDIPSSRERAISKAFSTLGNVFGRNFDRDWETIKSEPA